MVCCSSTWNKKAVLSVELRIARLMRTTDQADLLQHMFNSQGGLCWKIIAWQLGFWMDRKPKFIKLRKIYLWTRAFKGWVQIRTAWSFSEDSSRNKHAERNGRYERCTILTIWSGSDSCMFGTCSLSPSMLHTICIASIWVPVNPWWLNVEAMIRCQLDSWLVTSYPWR